MPASIICLLHFSSIWFQLGRSSVLFLLGPKWWHGISHWHFGATVRYRDFMHEALAGSSDLQAFHPELGGSVGTQWVPAGLAGPAAVLSEPVGSLGFSNDLSRTCCLKLGLRNLLSLGNWGRFPKAEKSQKLFWNYSSGCIDMFSFLMEIEALY